MVTGPVVGHDNTLELVDQYSHLTVMGLGSGLHPNADASGPNINKQIQFHNVIIEYINN